MRQDPKTVRTKQVEIAYEEHGAGSAGSAGGSPPVVLLHGFPDSPRGWDGVVAALADLPVRILVPYLRGYGATRVVTADAASGQGAALGQDVLDLSDALGIERFVLAGHDWGSRAAAAVALLAPHRLHALMLLASPYGAGDAAPEERLAQAQAFWYQWYLHTPQGIDALREDRRAFCRRLWRVWSPQWRFAEADFAATAASFDNDQFVDTVVHYYRHRWGNAAGSPVYARQQAALDGAPPLPVAATMVIGTADAVTPPAATRATARNFAAGVRFVDAPGAGHFIQREQPGLVAALLRAEITRSA